MPPRGKRKTEADKEAERIAREEEKRRKAQEREEAKQRKAADKEAEKRRKAEEREEAKRVKAAEKAAQREAEKRRKAEERKEAQRIKAAAKAAEKQAEKDAAAAANEPKIKWKKSKAKQLLYTDLKEGLVPLEAKDEHGKSTMKLNDIYNMRPEYAEYHYDKFSSRLSSLRKTVKDRIERQRLDQEAFDNYRTNHKEVSYYSHHGYIQWQGSKAQEQCLNDIKDGIHLKGKMKLWASKPEYYQNFPLKVFRDKLNQELRTAKYLYTLEERGKDPRKKHLKDQGRVEQANKEAEKSR